MEKTITEEELRTVLTEHGKNCAKAGELAVIEYLVNSMEIVKRMGSDTTFTPDEIIDMLEAMKKATPRLNK